MTSSGSGIGGDNVGAPIQPSIRQLETTASVEVAKSLMKIAVDTIDIPFFLLTQDVRKYQASANRPVLAPLMAVRTAAPGGTLPPETWQAQYDELVKLMPQDFQKFFQAMMLLPSAERSPDFNILDGILQQTAKALMFLQQASRPIEPESLAALHANTNIAMPYIAMGSLIPLSMVLLTEGRDFLELVGPEYPNFDLFTSSLSEFNNIAAGLQSAITMLENPDTAKEGQEVLAEAGEKIQQLSQSLSRYSGGDFSILINTLRAAQTISESLTLQQPGASSLLIGLSMATTGLGDPNSELALFGPALSAVNDNLSAALGASLLEGASLGGKALFEQLITVALLTTITFGALAPSAARDKSDEVTPEQRSADNFAYGLVLTLLGHSDTLSAFAATTSSAAEVSADQSTTLAEQLKLAAMLLLILANMHSNDPIDTTPLLQSQHQELKQGIAAAANFVSQALLSDTLSGDTAENINVYLQQANIALNREDYAGFVAALENCLELAGASSDQFVKDMKESKDEIKNVQINLLQSDSGNLTEINFAA